MIHLHLVPVVIQDLADKYEKANGQNEIYSLQQRLEAVRDFCNEILKINKKSQSNHIEYIKSGRTDRT